MTEIINKDEIKFPSITESGPDKDGIITIIEYKINENNQKVKVTKKVKRYIIEKKIYPAVEERKKNWTKFGAALYGNNNVTFVSPVDIFMEDPRKKEKKEMKPKEKCICIDQSTRDLVDLVLKMPVNERSKEENGLIDAYEQLVKKNKLNGFDKFIINEKSENENIPPVLDSTTDNVEKSKASVCKTCGGGHWKRFCPTTSTEKIEDDAVDDKHIEDSILSRTVIVSNLNKDTTEENIFELFAPIGQINKLYIAKDFETQASKGYGFVTYLHKKDAEKSIERLNNRGFEHLMLNVNWAKGKHSV